MLGDSVPKVGYKALAEEGNMNGGGKYYGN